MCQRHPKAVAPPQDPLVLEDGSLVGAKGLFVGLQHPPPPPTPSHSAWSACAIEGLRASDCMCQRLCPHRLACSAPSFAPPPCPSTGVLTDCLYPISRLLPHVGRGTLPKAHLPMAAAVCTQCSGTQCSGGPDVQTLLSDCMPPVVAAHMQQAAQRVAQLLHWSSSHVYGRFCDWGCVGTVRLMRCPAGPGTPQPLAKPQQHPGSVLRDAYGTAISSLCLRQPPVVCTPAASNVMGTSNMRERRFGPGPQQPLAADVVGVGIRKCLHFVCFLHTGTCT